MKKQIFVNHENEIILDRDSYGGIVWAYEVETDQELALKPNKALVLENSNVIEKDDFRGQKWFKKSDKSIYYPKLGDKLDLSIFTLEEPNADEIYDVKLDKWVKDKNFYIEKLSLEIENRFSEKMMIGVIHNGHRFRIDENSMSRGSVALQESTLYPEDITPVWIAECKVDSKGIDIPETENSKYPVGSVNIMKALYKSMKDQWKIYFFKRRELLDELLTLSIDQLLSYKINEKWL